MLAILCELHLFSLCVFTVVHLTTLSVAVTTIRSVEYGTLDALLVRNLGAAYGIRNSQRKI